MIVHNLPPPMPDIPIIEFGGTVHYSFEMRAYLATLPREEANRIIQEIEYRNRPQRVIDWESVRNQTLSLGAAGAP